MSFSVFESYYTLTKPGIVYGNTIVAAGAFLLVSTFPVSYGLMSVTLVGLLLIIASSCVCNNVIDADIDTLMERTKHRVIPKGSITKQSALVFAAVLGVTGFLILFLFSSLASFFAAFLGFFVYIVVYSLLLKRTSMYSTVVGSISGAMPPVASALAVTGTVTGEVALIFLLIALWQMPHFYALSLWRHKDFLRGGVASVPGSRGFVETKIQIPLYIVLFLGVVLLFFIGGYASLWFSLVLGAVTFGWLLLSFFGFTASHEEVWARRMFLYSLVVIFTFSVMAGFEIFFQTLT